jgi:hypothetical protein
MKGESFHWNGQSHLIGVFSSLSLRLALWGMENSFTKITIRCESQDNGYLNSTKEIDAGLS